MSIDNIGHAVIDTHVKTLYLNNVLSPCSSTKWPCFHIVEVLGVLAGLTCVFRTLASCHLVLRMELDIQNFMQNPQLQEFEFQNFPTSYLRCAAHRVAQHYGLETIVADSLVEGSVSRIVARKTAESRYPAIFLSEVPSNQARNDHETAEKLKFVIYQRPKAFQNGSADSRNKSGVPKTVDERIEEYNKARARIFNGSISADSDAASIMGTLSTGKDEPVNVDPSVDETKVSTMNSRSRVAVFKDTEKDRSDPDYDRNYKRYVRSSVPGFNLSPGVFNFVVPQFMQYDIGYVQSPGMSTNQHTMYFGQPDLTIGSSGAAVYRHWPTPTMMYPHCYDNVSPMMSQTK
ncbi:DBF1-interactor protein 1 isoform X2 [Zea mays]|uniref:DBF1-interactor protein 1 isoform X2 n=1 Tax=Zea mays TaxID=4577 RepID=UPI0016521361|nr:DBF1-interactor protein 1 isoform X2 [Zea mays]